MFKKKKKEDKLTPFYEDGKQLLNDLEVLVVAILVQHSHGILVRQDWNLIVHVDRR
jgi:hypothetical protein